MEFKKEKDIELEFLISSTPTLHSIPQTNYNLNKYWYNIYK